MALGVDLLFCGILFGCAIGTAGYLGFGVIADTFIAGLFV